MEVDDVAVEAASTSLRAPSSDAEEVQSVEELEEQQYADTPESNGKSEHPEKCPIKAETPAEEDYRTKDKGVLEESSHLERIAKVQVKTPKLIVPPSDVGGNREKQKSVARKLIGRGEYNHRKDSLLQHIIKSADFNWLLKRRPRAIRRCGSDQMLLGFDEETGEASLIVSSSDGSSNDLRLVKEKEGEVLSPIYSTPLTKAFKQSPSETPSVKNSPRSLSSPVVTPPPLRSSQSISSPKKRDEPAKQQHVVADNEDAEVADGGSEISSTNTSRLMSSNNTVKNTVKVSSTPTSTSAPASASVSVSVPATAPTTLKDDCYKKPFEYGWKRELVYRANMETSKDKADVYFISPTGKKLRTRSEIAPLLDGELTLENFSFAREPLGLGIEYETVRHAKPSHRASNVAASLAAAAPVPAHPGKRISKPKVPKGASPPPQGWTPVRALKTNNAALLSSVGSSKHSMAYPTTPTSRHVNSGTSKGSKANKKPVVSEDVIGGAASASTIAGVAGSTHEPCTMNCPHARGQIPQLKCAKCLCLYHHECVGLNRQNSEYRVAGELSSPGSRDYICDSCLPVKSVNAIVTTAAGVVATTSATATATAASAKSSHVEFQSSVARNAKRKLEPPEAVPTTVATATGSAERTNLTSNVQTITKRYPQNIAVVKGKKYLVVTKPTPSRSLLGTSTDGHRPLHYRHLNDIENDLKQINESIRSGRKSSWTSTDAPSQTNSSVTDVAQKSFATNFFANVSFAYDALLCILKYLKIHERLRAASVCKLWHLAAKDTSLWQTVRMKNSKVSDWSGFAAALRRGETKHLDLRKMLLSNTNTDEMWRAFNRYIGTVYSLEVIDLCRCSAKVVENLFESCSNLRVLNALAINDESYSLEKIGQLPLLSELRLRTCEPGTLDGDLLALESLTNLTHLSLTSLLDLGTKSIEALGSLSNLSSIELGECGDFDSKLACDVLPKLTNLRRLRLENGLKTNCCTLEILDSVVRLKTLSQLEFVNFDIKPGFDEKLKLCTNIRKLLIIPTYISQSATTNQIVLYAVQQIADTLKVFTWGVTVELLRVTALYVDQCEELTKTKHHFDECIPVMKPVPGAVPSSVQDEYMNDVGPNAVPQIEILPLDKVESILGDTLTTTKYTIVKVPYQLTCRQHLVE